MPRQARLDAPCTLATRDGARARSQLLFRDDADRADFVARLAGLAASGAWLVFAWALLFNHLHLLVEPQYRTKVTGARDAHIS